MDLVKVFLMLAGHDHGTGAQAVAQRVHGGGGLSLRSFRTVRMPRVAAICRDLSLCCHVVTFSEQSEPIGRAALADIDKKRRCQERAMGRWGDAAILSIRVLMRW